VCGGVPERGRTRIRRAVSYLARRQRFQFGWTALGPRLISAILRCECSHTLRHGSAATYASSQRCSDPTCEAVFTYIGAESDRRSQLIASTLHARVFNVPVPAASASAMSDSFDFIDEEEYGDSPAKRAGARKQSSAKLRRASEADAEEIDLTGSAPRSAGKRGTARSGKAKQVSKPKAPRGKRRPASSDEEDEGEAAVSDATDDDEEEESEFEPSDDERKRKNSAKKRSAAGVADGEAAASARKAPSAAKRAVKSADGAPAAAGAKGQRPAFAASVQLAAGGAKRKTSAAAGAKANGAIRHRTSVGSSKGGGAAAGSDADDADADADASMDVSRADAEADEDGDPDEFGGGAAGSAASSSSAAAADGSRSASGDAATEGKAKAAPRPKPAAPLTSMPLLLPKQAKKGRITALVQVEDASLDLSGDAGACVVFREIEASIQDAEGCTVRQLLRVILIHACGEEPICCGSHRGTGRCLRCCSAHRWTQAVVGRCFMALDCSVHLPPLSS